MNGDHQLKDHCINPGEFLRAWARGVVVLIEKINNTIEYLGDNTNKNRWEFGMWGEGK